MAIDLQMKKIQENALPIIPEEPRLSITQLLIEDIVSTYLPSYNHSQQQHPVLLTTVIITFN